MWAEETLTSLVRVCQAELLRIIEEMETRPSRTAFFDLGAVVEVLVLANGSAEGNLLRRPLSDAAARWLKSGLLEDLLMARVEFGYHVAVLTYMARGSESWRDSDMEVIRNLSDGRLIARNELPVLRQVLITSYFSRIGAGAASDELDRRNLATVIDRRAVRARPSDEFDLLALLNCAHLIQLDHHRQRDIPRVFPHVQLVQALRSGNRNWLPVLTFLCLRFFGLLEKLRSTVSTSLRESVPADGQLLPPPPASQIDSEHIERTERGLRLRSTIALALSLASSGGLRDDAQVTAAVS